MARLRGQGAELTYLRQRLNARLAWRCGIEWIDLHLDVRVTPLGEVQALDRDDFEKAREISEYSSEVADRAFAAWNELQLLANARTYPFDHDLQVMKYREVLAMRKEP